MKGLLIKDLQLVLVNKRLLILLFVLAVFFVNTMDEISFVNSFIIMMFEMLAISTLSYDNFNNSNAFLMTLPIKRKDYVIEKYLFILLMTVVGVVCSIILSFIYGISMGEKVEIDIIIGVAVGFLAYSSIAVPLELKFGSEMGKVIPVFICVFGFLAYQMTKNIDDLFKSKISIWAIDKVEKIEKAGDVAIVVSLLVVAVVVISISMAASIKAMNKKEF